MYFLHIGSEMAPVAKVGGLGDVLLGLSRELSWKGHDVDIIIPKYDCMDSDAVRDLTIDTPNLPSFYQGEWYSNTIWMGWVENLKVYFIEPHHPRHFFDRGCFYGCEDDIERYLYFARTALEFTYKKQLNPDIIHVHDWQAAAIPILYREMYNQLGFNKPKIVFTIHNIEYQGRCATHDLASIGLKADPEAVRDPRESQLVNLMKGAINYSDFVTTVSPTYANEVLTPEGGKGLETVLRSQIHKFQGVLNGIDYSYWNPELDRYLPTHFSSREVPESKKDRNTLDKKGFLKLELRHRVALADSHKPIVGCVTRLVPQKGLELIKAALEYTLKHHGQFVLLGSSPIPEITSEFLEIKHRYDDDPDIQLILHHEEELAHFIYGGSDIFIVPSIFEPCGLTQMIALKYGSIPVVRNTGGLADTIFDVDATKPPEEGNGFVFHKAKPEEIEKALGRAFEIWFHDQERWRNLVIKGMNLDHSWDKPANIYLGIYKQLLGL